MKKKNPNRFTISFNQSDDRQAFAANKLNQLGNRSIAIYIAQAIYKFENGTKSCSGRALSAQPITSEKRGRGRPKKIKTIESSNGIDFQKLDSQSSSHITQPVAVGIHTNETTKSNLHTQSADGVSTSISSDMVDSMMQFVAGNL